MIKAMNLWEQLLMLLRYRRYSKFWETNCDRGHMKHIIYPAVGELFSPGSACRVLDIGCQWYNAYNYLMFKNSAIEYWLIDKLSPPRGLIRSEFIRDTFIGLESRRTDLIGQFDVVISYGVLGFYPIHLEDAQSYLRSAWALLKEDGLFLWKIDVTRMDKLHRSFRINRSIGDSFFRPLSRGKLRERQSVVGGGQEYEFLTLGRKP